MSSTESSTSVVSTEKKMSTPKTEDVDAVVDDVGEDTDHAATEQKKQDATTSPQQSSSSPTSLPKKPDEKKDDRHHHDDDEKKKDRHHDDHERKSSKSHSSPPSRSNNNNNKPHYYPSSRSSDYNHHRPRPTNSRLRPRRHASVRKEYQQLSTMKRIVDHWKIHTTRHKRQRIQQQQLRCEERSNQNSKKQYVGFYPPKAKSAPKDENDNNTNSTTPKEDNDNNNDSEMDVAVEILEFDENLAVLALKNPSFKTPREDHRHREIPWYEQRYEELPWWEYPDLDEDDEITALCKLAIQEHHQQQQQQQSSFHNNNNNNSFSELPDQTSSSTTTTPKLFGQAIDMAWHEQSQADRVEALVMEFVLKLKNRARYTRIQRRRREEQYYHSKSKSSSRNNRDSRYSTTSSSSRKSATNNDNDNKKQSIKAASSLVDKFLEDLGLPSNSDHGTESTSQHNDDNNNDNNDPTPQSTEPATPETKVEHKVVEGTPPMSADDSIPIKQNEAKAATAKQEETKTEEANELEEISTEPIDATADSTITDENEARAEKQEAHHELLETVPLDDKEIQRQQEAQDDESAENNKLPHDSMTTDEQNLTTGEQPEKQRREEEESPASSSQQQVEDLELTTTDQQDKDEELSAAMEQEDKEAHSSLQQLALNLQHDQQEAMYNLLHPSSPTVPSDNTSPETDGVKTTPPSDSAKPKITKEDVAKLAAVNLDPTQKRFAKQRKLSDSAGSLALDDDSVSLHSAVLSTGWNRLNIHNSELRRYQKNSKRYHGQVMGDVRQGWADDHTVVGMGDINVGGAYRGGNLLQQGHNSNLSSDDGHSVFSFQSSPAMMEYAKTKQLWQHRKKPKEPKKLFHLTTSATTGTAAVEELPNDNGSNNLKPIGKKKKKKKKKAGHLALFMAKEKLRTHDEDQADVFVLNKDTGQVRSGAPEKEQSDQLILESSQFNENNQHACQGHDHSSVEGGSSDKEGVPSKEKRAAITQDSFNQAPGNIASDNTQANSQDSISSQVQDERTPERNCQILLENTDEKGSTEVFQDSSDKIAMAFEVSEEEEEEGDGNDFSEGSAQVTSKEASEGSTSSNESTSSGGKVPQDDESHSGSSSQSSTHCGDSSQDCGQASASCSEEDSSKQSDSSCSSSTTTAAKSKETGPCDSDSEESIDPFTTGVALPEQADKPIASDTAEVRHPQRGSMRRVSTISLGYDSLHEPNTVEIIKVSKPRDDDSSKPRVKTKKQFMTRRASFSELELSQCSELSSLATETEKDNTAFHQSFRGHQTIAIRHNLDAAKYRLVMLRHAAMCKQHGGACPSDPKCSQMKELLRHMAACKHQSSVTPCPYPECQESKTTLIAMHKTSQILSQQRQFQNQLPPVVTIEASKDNEFGGEQHSHDDDDISDIASFGSADRILSKSHAQRDGGDAEPLESSSGLVGGRMKMPCRSSSAEEKKVKKKFSLEKICEDGLENKHSQAPQLSKEEIRKRHEEVKARLLARVERQQAQTEMRKKHEQLKARLQARVKLAAETHTSSISDGRPGSLKQPLSQQMHRSLRQPRDCQKAELEKIRRLEEEESQRAAKARAELAEKRRLEEDERQKEEEEIRKKHEELKYRVERINQAEAEAKAGNEAAKPAKKTRRKTLPPNTSRRRRDAAIMNRQRAPNNDISTPTKNFPSNSPRRRTVATAQQVTQNNLPDLELISDKVYSQSIEAHSEVERLKAAKAAKKLKRQNRRASASAL